MGSEGRGQRSGVRSQRSEVGDAEVWHHGAVDGADVEVGWRERAVTVQAASRRAFWLDGRWYDDLQRSTSSQLATALAILTRTTEPAEEPVLLDALAARSLNPSDDPIPGDLVLASPYMHHRVFEALRHSGRTQEVIDIIRLRWGRWVEAGYPTAWENWNVDFPDGSQCHGYAAHPLYHLAQIATAHPSFLPSQE